MRRVEILVTCDPCLAWLGVDVSEEVETVPLVGGHTLDLCPTHRDGLREVLALIGEFADGAAVGIPASAHLPASTRRAVDRAVEKATADRGPKRTRRSGRKERARREAAAVVAGAEAITAAAVVEGGRLPCPLCPHTSPTSKALAVHLSTMHSTTPSAVYGRVCPLCGREEANGQVLAGHARRAHEVEGGLAPLFVRAEAEGDPHGVVAARAAALVEAAGS